MDMTCIDITLEDLLGCSLGISKAKAALLATLMGENWMTVAETATKLKKDRSVIQRELSALHEKGLISREQRNKETGGYEYLYRAADRKALKSTIAEKSRAFVRMIDKKIKDW